MKRRVFVSILAYMVVLLLVSGAIAASVNLSDVKARLKELGYDPGVIDNTWNDTVKAALEKYQIDHKLTITREWDQRTLQSLGLLPASPEETLPSVSGKEETIKYDRGKSTQSIGRSSGFVITDTEQGGKRSTGISNTSGTFNFEKGEMKYDVEFSGDIIAFDSISKGAIKLSSGMTKERVEKIASENNVRIIKKSDDEWQVGDKTIGFVDNKLKRLRN